MGTKAILRDFKGNLIWAISSFAAKGTYLEVQIQNICENLSYCADQNLNFIDIEVDSKYLFDILSSSYPSSTIPW